MLVTMNQPKCERNESPKLWIANLNLFELYRNDLLDPVGCMSDSIINAAQKLLKRQFPSLNGLQDVITPARKRAG